MNKIENLVGFTITVSNLDQPELMMTDIIAEVSKIIADSMGFHILHGRNIGGEFCDVKIEPIIFVGE